MWAQAVFLGCARPPVLYATLLGLDSHVGTGPGLRRASCNRFRHVPRSGGVFCGCGVVQELAASKVMNIKKRVIRIGIMSAQPLLRWKPAPRP